ncbi:hypothetical protein D3C87_1374830 [compost metagenome]
MTGPIIRALRISKRMTQAEFSAALGISPSWLCEIEKERKPVSDRVRGRVGQLFDSEEEIIEIIRRAKMTERLSF